MVGFGAASSLASLHRVKGIERRTTADTHNRVFGPENIDLREYGIEGALIELAWVSKRAGDS